MKLFSKQINKIIQMHLENQARETSVTSKYSRKKCSMRSSPTLSAQFLEERTFKSHRTFVETYARSSYTRPLSEWRIPPSLSPSLLLSIVFSIRSRLPQPNGVHIYGRKNCRNASMAAEKETAPQFQSKGIQRDAIYIQRLNPQKNTIFLCFEVDRD